MKSLALIAALLALASCGSPQDSAPAGVTRQEAQALNDAAAMLDNQSDPANASH